jgi:HEAT repeat protein
MSLVAAVLLLGQADGLEALAKQFEEERSKPREERSQTVRKIAALATDPALAFLEKVFETEKDEGLRLDTLWYLGTCGSERTLKKVVALARDEAAPYNFRYRAIEALGESHPAAAFEALVVVAKNKDRKNKLRGPALAAVAKYPIEATQAFWREALAGADAELRAQAFRALAPLSDGEVLDRASKAIRDAKENRDVRYAAMEAWLKAGGAAAVPAVVVALEDPDPAVRAYVFGALASYKDAGVLEAARKTLLDPKETRDVKSAALAVWTAKGGPESAAILLPAVDAAEPAVRAEIYKALAPLKDEKVLERARKSIEDPKEGAVAKSAAVDLWLPPAGPEVVKLLVAAAATTDAALRKKLADALSSLTDEKSIDVLLESFKAGPVPARTLVARALGRVPHPRALDALDSAFKGKDEDVQLAAVDAVAERKEKRSEDILLREAQRGDGEISAAATRALARVPSDKTAAYLLKLAQAKDFDTRVVALRTLGEMRAPEGVKALQEALNAREWPLRAVVIQALAGLKTKESVDLLVGRMAKEDGRLLADISEALRGLTGKALGYGAGAWKEWWTVNRETFEFKDKPEGVAAGGAGVTTYYGVPVVSKRIAFCLDISGSMSATVGAGPRTRLDVAKDELERVLETLGAGVNVNLIFFDDVIEAWHQRLVPIKSNIASAKSALRSRFPRGGTNIFDTLEAAFQDKEVDTIYLLSDGDPGAGKFVAPEEILREIRKLNRTRLIVIHTISLGPSDFMRRLAEENGGKYVEK